MIVVGRIRDQLGPPVPRQDATVSQLWCCILAPDLRSLGKRRQFPSSGVASWPRTSNLLHLGPPTTGWPAVGDTMRGRTHQDGPRPNTPGPFRPVVPAPPPGQPALLCARPATEPCGEHQRWSDDHHPPRWSTPQRLDRTAPWSPRPLGQPALLCVCPATGPSGEHRRWSDDHPFVPLNGHVPFLACLPCLPCRVPATSYFSCDMILGKIVRMISKTEHWLLPGALGRKGTRG